MSKDQQTYQRAVNASLLGLGVQLAVSAMLLILGLWSGSAVLSAAGWHAVGGLALWLCLAIVFQQHKRERAEALEAEQIAQRHGTDTSIFENVADELAVDRKRLVWMHRWLVSGVALLTSAYLIGVGIWVLGAYREKFDSVTLPTKSILGTLSAMASVALVGFLISRYLAGMAKVAQWQMLRAGASYLMGNVLMALLIAAGLMLANAEIVWFYKGLIYVVPTFMILVGIEIVLNFILNLYRPRKAGEAPRPAFDSRLLSLLTSPESLAKSINEAINYQFGFEVTRSWFWQLLSRVFGWLVLMGVAVLLLISSVLIVEPHEQAVVVRLGSLRGEPLKPGIHLKLPWPLEQAEQYDVTSVRVITIGKDETGQLTRPTDPMDPGVTNEKVILWTNTHADKELDLIVAPESDPSVGDPKDPAAPRRIVPVSLVNAEIALSYRINPEGLLDYVQAHADAAAVEHKRLKNTRIRSRWTARQVEDDKFKPPFNEHVARLNVLATAQVTRYMLRHTIDQWIGAASVTAGPDLHKLIQDQVDRAGLGVQITHVAITGIHPPKTVADDFHAVVGAEQKKQTAIETARQEATRTLVNAAGSVDLARRLDKLRQEHDKLVGDQAKRAEIDRQINVLLRQADGSIAEVIAEARRYRWERENTELGRAMAFDKQLQAYRKAPLFYRARAFLKLYTQGLADARKYIIAADRANLTIRGDFKEIEGNLNIQAPQER